MRIDPLAISVGALVVSVISLLYTLYTGSNQRRIQVEQTRLAIQSGLLRLTLKTLDMVRQILQSKPSGIAVISAQSLAELAQDICEVWSKMPKLKIPRLILSASYATFYQRLKSDVDDLHELVSSLADLIASERFDELKSKADLLRSRVSGFVTTKAPTISSEAVPSGKT